jgi:hypothetical protein
VIQGGANPRQGKRRGSKGGKKKKRRGGPGKGSGQRTGPAQRTGPGQGQAHRMGPPRRRPKGYCECPACGTKVAVYTEVPCYIMNCSKCGSTMKRSGSSKSPQEILPQ